MRATMLLACAVSCAGRPEEPPPRFPIPQPLFASKDASKGGAASVACAGSNRYDAAGGCISAGSGVPLRVGFRNDTSAAFRLTGVALALDGELLFDANDGHLMRQKRFMAITTRAWAGEHEVGARLYFAGHGHGVFAYLKGYRFEVVKQLRFTLKTDRDVELTVVGYEQGGVTTPVEERPAVRLEQVGAGPGY
jgi:hypothetical protein